MNEIINECVENLSISLNISRDKAEVTLLENLLVYNEVPNPRTKSGKVLKWIIDNYRYTILPSGNNNRLSQYVLYGDTGCSCDFVADYLRSVFDLFEGRKFTINDEDLLKIDVNPIFNEYPIIFQFVIEYHTFTIITMDGIEYYYLDYFEETQRENNFRFSILNKQQIINYIKILVKGDIYAFTKFNYGSDIFYNEYSEFEGKSILEYITVYDVRREITLLDVLRATMMSTNNSANSLSDSLGDIPAEQRLQVFKKFIRFHKMLYGMVLNQQDLL